MTNIKIEEITDILNRPRGSSLTYHVGHLSIDRAKHRVDGPGIVEYSDDERQAFEATAVVADSLQTAGHVALVQRKLGPHRYQYIAQRC